MYDSAGRNSDNIFLWHGLAYLSYHIWLIDNRQNVTVIDCCKSMNERSPADVRVISMSYMDNIFLVYTGVLY